MGELFNFIFRVKRAKIGNILVDASVRELHEARSEITTNPIEDGADITDHVRNMPLTMTMQGVISDTPIGLAFVDNIKGIIGTATTIFGGSSRSHDAYDDLMKLRKTREPFDLVTGLKVYQNMILQDLRIERTAKTGKSIQFTARLKQIEIARTKKVAAPLKSDAANIGAVKADIGKKVSDIVPPNSPIATGSDVTTSETQGTKGASWLFQYLIKD